MDVSKSVGIFKSKVETFLKDFQGQLSNYEISFWKERLNITLTAAKTYNQSRAFKNKTEKYNIGVKENKKRFDQKIVANKTVKSEVEEKNVPYTDKVWLDIVNTQLKL